MHRDNSHLLNALCASDANRQADAEPVGIEAIEARIALWDGVLQELHTASHTG